MVHIEEALLILISFEKFLAVNYLSEISSF